MNIFTINNILFLSILLVIVMAIFLTATLYKYFKENKANKVKLINGNVVYDLPEEYKELQEEYIMPKWIKAVLISFAVLILTAICFFTFTKIKSYYDNKPKVLPNGTVVYDFSTQRQPRASKILYEYIIAEEFIKKGKMSLDIDSIIAEYRNIKNYAKIVFNVAPENVYAFEYDLNNDGVKEIIGYIKFYNKYPAGNNLYIIQKNNNNYYSITENFTGFGPEKRIYISTYKTNSYKDIIFSSSERFYFRPIGIKYSKHDYYKFIHLFDE